MQSANPRRWAALGLIALAQFMVIMDTSIIGVALPEIRTNLGFGAGDLSWVFNAYVIAFGGLLLLGGPPSPPPSPPCSPPAACSPPAGRSSPAPRWPPASPRPPAWRSPPAQHRAP